MAGMYVIRKLSQIDLNKKTNPSKSDKIFSKLTNKITKPTLPPKKNTKSFPF